MKLTTPLLPSLLLLGASIALPACATSSPDNFVEKSAKLSCQYMKECEPDMFDMFGFDSVNDCRDKTLDAPIGDQGSFRDFFVDNCTDFDRGKARTCLKAARQAKRDCSQNDEPACQEVCGDQAEMGELLLEPHNPQLVARILEDMGVDEGVEAEAVLVSE